MQPVLLLQIVLDGGVTVPVECRIIFRKIFPFAAISPKRDSLFWLILKGLDPLGLHSSPFTGLGNCLKWLNITLYAKPC
jgi:hypothetical protein